MSVAASAATTPTVTWMPPSPAGLEGNSIALGTVTASGTSLTAITISGLEAGAILSDGTHSFTASTGTISANILGWNGAALSITPPRDVNMVLSVQATDSTGATSAAATETVVVTPLAPTVSPAAVSGNMGQPTALNLSLSVNGLSSDANSLASLTISGIPAGVTFSNANNDTLAVAGGTLTFSAAQIAGGALDGLSVRPTAAGSFTLSVSATEQDAEGDLSAAKAGTETVTVSAGTTTGAGTGVPTYSHVVVVIEENKQESQIIGDTADAPYINSLATGGALLSNYHAITHPSEPNYFALYAGSTFGVADDNSHTEPDPTLATVLQSAGLTFQGYVDESGSDFDHDPWVSFPEGRSVQTSFGPGINDATFSSLFPSGDFSSLPTVSFVIPGVGNDMHNGTIQQGDSWLQTNLAAYAQWAQANNSLLVVTWDENDAETGTSTDPTNQVPAILYGAHVAPGTYSAPYNHYNMLSTLLAGYGLTGPNNAATAAPIQVFTTGTMGSTVGSGLTINTTVSGPVALSASETQLTITGTGTVISTGASGDGIDGPAGVPWTITNSGLISSASALGISLAGPGAITNAGSISGTEAIRLGSGGTVANSGTLTGTGDAGVFLSAGGSISNAAGGLIQAAGTSASAIFLSGVAGTITNAGSIDSAYEGVLVSAGGTVMNQSTGRISGADAGVFVRNLPGSVLNAGTVVGTGTNGTGIYLQNNGTITNLQGGYAWGQKFGVFLEGGAGTVANSGTIIGATYDGVILGLGGTVTNAAGASITGVTGGVYGKYRAAAAVTNAGTITTTGTHGTGVDLADGGSLDNTAQGTISGSDNGVFITGEVGTVSNQGSISAGRYHGVSLRAGGEVTNAAGAAIVGGSAGVFSGTGTGTGTVNAAGTVVNDGTIQGTSTSGTGGVGADIESGGTVVNGAGAVLSGVGGGAFFSGAAGVLTNSGSIAGLHGVIMKSGGSIGNTAGGVIQGQASGVFADGSPVSVTNAGAIVATATGGAAVDIEGGGTVVNASGASLSGAGFGVFMTGGTVVTAGSISGGTYAVKFAGSGTTNRLVVQPGAVFTGAVGGASAGTNTLEFAGGTGTISGMATGAGAVTEGGQTWLFYSNFGSIAVDAGADWTFSGLDSATALEVDGTASVTGALTIGGVLSGTGQVLVSSNSTLVLDGAVGAGGTIGFQGTGGTLTIGDLKDCAGTIVGFGPGETLQLAGVVDASVTYTASGGGTGMLEVISGGSVAGTLTLAGNYAGMTFAAASGATTSILAVASDPPPANTPPTITGTAADQTTTDYASIRPFSGTTVSDPDQGATANATITVKDRQGNLSDSDGTLTGTGLNKTGTGTYVLAAVSPGSLTAELQGLVFTPTPREVPGGQTVTTSFTIAVNDGQATTTDTQTSVAARSVSFQPIATAGPGDLGLHGPHSDYIVALNPTGGTAVVQDQVSGRDGTQTLSALHDMIFADGIGRIDPTGNAEEVARLYQAALGRAPDAAGLDAWAGALNAGTLNLSEVAARFISAPEFTTRYGSLDNAGFVQQLYQNVLGRASEAAGMQAWVGALDASALSRAQVLLGFSDSAENKDDTAATIGDKDRGEAWRLYQAAFNRTPDQSGLDTWTTQLDQGSTPLQVAQAFVASTEFTQDFTGLDNTGFVSQLYRNVLHRTGEAAGVQAWTAQLDAGAQSRAQVLLGFSDSLENRLDTAATHDGWVYMNGPPA